MSYQNAVIALLQEEGVEESTMMKTPCLRYQGEFLTMIFEKEDSLIVKVSPDRVNELIKTGIGMEFNFTKKCFKEWVLIPMENEAQFQSLMIEALDYAKMKKT